MEEERRLAYVAITRAERRLCLSSVQERMVYGKVQDMLPSRFLSEIPSYEMEWDGSSVVRRLDARPSRSRMSTGSVRPTYPSGATRGGAALHSSSSHAGWRAGDGVEHNIFGRGQVVRVIAASPEPRLVVRFGGNERTLLPSIAKLRKV